MIKCFYELNGYSTLVPNSINYLRINHLPNIKIKLRKNSIKSDSFNFCKDSEKMRNLKRILRFFLKFGQKDDKS